jgi:hypothetical protein
LAIELIDYATLRRRRSMEAPEADGQVSDLDQSSSMLLARYGEALPCSRDERLNMIGRVLRP